MLEENSNTAKTFIYLHGFNSDGIGYKPDALKAAFREAKIYTPDLAANPQKVIEQINLLIEKEHRDKLYFIGTSLGGFYAWYFSAIWERPGFLYNPSLQPHITLDGRGVGEFKTWTKGRDYHFKAEYLPMLAKMKLEADTLIQAQNLNFFLAKDDDVLDHSSIPKKYPNANHLQWFEQEGHRFSSFAKTLSTVKEIIERNI